MQGWIFISLRDFSCRGFLAPEKIPCKQISFFALKVTQQYRYRVKRINSVNHP